MKVKSAYTILCLCMVLGIFTGCGAKEKEAEALPVAEDSASLETVDEPEDEAADKTEDEAAIEMMDEETPGSDSEKLNAVGMPLMDNTALLATIKTQSGKISKQYEYDKEGHMLRYLGMTYNYMYEFEYDSAGNLSRETDWHYDDEWRETDRRLAEQTEYAYDGAGRLLGRMMREYGDDGSLERCFVYAGSGQQSWEMRYLLFDVDGNVSEQYRCEYDDKGNETLWVQYDAEGKINLFEGYECDTYISYYPYRRSENTYDDFGNLIKITIYGYENNDGTTYKKYTYDDAGHLIKEEEIAGDPYTQEYTYNEQGYLVSSFSSDSYGVYGKEYEYDDNGNCIKELYRHFERDEAGNVSDYGASIAQENQFDERNRLMRVYHAYDDTTYDYTYETIGVPDEDYPYDKIEIYGKIEELWYE